MTSSQLKAYVKAQFRIRNPKAGEIDVRYLSTEERWLVTVDIGTGRRAEYAMDVGSDDDDFCFHPLDVAGQALRSDVVRFPLPKD